MKTIALTINGRLVSCPAGTSVLDAALNAGIEIPSLCRHPDLKPFGACRLCLVEDVKTGRIAASCVTPAAPEMAVETDTPRVLKHRRNIVRLMMAEHPESCLVCSKGNRCRLREIAARLGVGPSGLYPMPNYKPFEQANPFITRDLSKCILCGKCIRADHELVVTGAIDYNSRGFRSRPAALYDLGLEQSNCTFCGTCVSICPTGALSEKNARYVGTPERQATTTCGFCGIGCALTMGAAGGRVVEVHPAHLRESVNGSTLCVRGHFAHDFLNSPDRLGTPMIREGEEMTPVSWDAALRTVAERLLDIKQRNGPQSIAFFGSSKCTNEENYLFQKIARVLAGTNNVDNGGYLSGRTALGVVDERTNGGRRKNPLSSLEQAEAVFVLGADPTHSLPVMGYCLKRAARRGAVLAVADPRRTELVDFSSLWLPLLPGRDLDLLNGLSALLCRRHSYDASFIDRSTEGFSDYKDGLDAVDLDAVCRRTGLSSDLLDETADLLKRKRIAFVAGRGVSQQAGGKEVMETLVNLALMTGSLGPDGAGVYIPARENNLMGAWDMGAVPDSLPGRWPVKDEAARKGWSRIWQANISPDKGLDLFRMIEEAEKGNLKAMYVMGENPLRSLPDPVRVRKALQRLDLLVVQDILSNETTEIADVILPGAAFSEKGGSFTNMEGRIQSFDPVAPPPGEAMADWGILDRLASEMGRSPRYGSFGKIRAEISRFIPMYRELDGGKGVAWVSTRGRLSGDEEGKESFAFSPVVEPKEAPPDEDHPFALIFGDHRCHLGSGTRTAHSERVKGFDLKGEVGVSPGDAARLDLREGDAVRIISRAGSVEREVKVQSGLNPGLLFLPLAYHSNDARLLLGLTPLGEQGSPGWNACAAKLEKKAS